MNTEVSKSKRTAKRKISNREKRVAILVVGMHRSGTSMVTRILNILGADISKNLLSPAKNDNESGFWESITLIKIHEELLSSLGATWSDIGSFPENWHTTDKAINYKNILIDYLKREFESSRYFVIKDPRICRLLPLWKDVLEALDVNLVAVLPFRNPREVASSLSNRNNFTPQHSYLLWLRHVLEAEKNTRNINRSFVLYDDILRDWRTSFDRISSDICVNWPKRGQKNFRVIDNFINTAYRHYEFDRNSLDTDSEISAWICKAYDSLCELVINKNNKKAFKEMDRIFHELESAEKVYRPLLASKDIAMHDNNVHIKELNIKITRLIEKIASPNSIILNELLNNDWYINNNPDLVDINRYEHWIKYGKDEGRLPSNDAIELVSELISEKEKITEENISKLKQDTENKNDYITKEMQKEIKIKETQIEALHSKFIELETKNNSNIESLLNKIIEYEQSNTKIREANEANYQRLISEIISERHAFKDKITHLEIKNQANIESLSKNLIDCEQSYTNLLEAKEADYQKLQNEISQLQEKINDITTPYIRRLLNKLRIVKTKPIDNIVERQNVKFISGPLKTSMYSKIKSIKELLSLDNVSFINSVYRLILHREPDDEGKLHYLNLLHDGMDKVKIINNFLTSPEVKKINELQFDYIRKITKRQRGTSPFLSWLISKITKNKLNLNELMNSQLERLEYQMKYENSNSELQKFLSLDAQQYLYINKDVASSGINPYEHYVKYGYKEGRATQRKIKIEQNILKCQWLDKQNDVKIDVESIPVDIIIPVYNGYEYLEPLFDSLLQNTRKPYRVIIINDCSSDTRVLDIINLYSKRFSDCLVLQNEKNKGFILTVNKGFTHVKAEFLILLNTDTEVPPGWLNRMIYPMLLDSSIASVTPFSNAATTCSFPEPLIDNELFLEFTVNEIDACFSQITLLPQPINLPSGIGFCMGIRKKVIDEIGNLDPVFGRGYGEENDWCLRAAEKGYKNILVNNLFVYHKHGGSFTSEEKKKLIDNNLKIISNRYPYYHDDVQTHILLDPAKSIREFIKLALLSRNDSGAVLIIDHELGGGANDYRNNLINTLTKKGELVVLLINDTHIADKPNVVAYMQGRNARFELPNNDAVLTLLNIVHIREVIYNNLVSCEDPLQFIELLRNFIIRNELPLTMLIHDYYPVCPSYTLLNKSGVYCKVPEDINECNNCLHKIPEKVLLFHPNVKDITTWRSKWGKLGDCAKEIRCFSESSKHILVKAFPNWSKKCTIIPHQINYKPLKIPAPDTEKNINIGIVGAINYSKGRDIIKSLMEYVRNRKINYTITVIGDMDIKIDGVKTTGRYELDHLPELIENNNINIILIPSIWPETFSYVTSEIILLDMPIACFDIGAPAERVKGYAKGCILSSYEPEKLINEIKLLYNRCCLN